MMPLRGAVTGPERIFDCFSLMVLPGAPEVGPDPPPLHSCLPTHQR